MTVNRNEVATTGIRLGKISNPMIRQLFSPMIRAEPTKSGLRMDRVWAGSCRAPNAQPVTLMMTPITRSFGLAPLPRNPKMTISSGSAGSTRKMLASRETGIGDRPPASSWDSTSCWTWVVPSQCAADGGSGVLTVVEELAFGLYGATSGPMMATIPNATDRHRPIRIFGDRSNRVMSGLLPGPRVEERVDEVGGQIGQQHRQRDDQEDPLQQRVVVAADRGEQQVPHARVGEDDLGQQRAGDDEPDGQGEAGHAGQP